MMNDGVNDDASTEVVQIVEEDREEVEEPQVLNHCYNILFYILNKNLFRKLQKKNLQEIEESTTVEVKMDRYEELISLENCDVIPNSEPIECPVCFVTYGPREGVILRDCLHMFCR